jgi:hypothetical protein
VPDGASHRQVVVVVVRILVRVRVLRVLATLLADIADVAVAAVCLELVSLGARHLANLRAHVCHMRSTRPSTLCCTVAYGDMTALLTFSRSAALRSQPTQ